MKRCVSNRWEGMIVGVPGPGENSDNFLVVSGTCVFHAWPNKQSKQTNLGGGNSNIFYSHPETRGNDAENQWVSLGLFHQVE